MADADDRTWRLLIMGAPGSGKGTQAARLCDELGIPAISTGDMLRQAMQSGTQLGRRVGEIVHSGSLVDDATMEQILRQRLSEGDVGQGFLLDGYPRTEAQVEALDRILEDLGVPLDLVILLEVSEEELLLRALGRGRQDDTEEVVLRRIRVFRAQTEPVLDIYRTRGLLTAVDGRRSVEEVAGSLRRVLEEAA